MEMIKRFLNDESGATMVEYAILVALIAIAVVATVVLIGQALDANFEAVRACVADGVCS